MNKQSIWPYIATLKPQLRGHVQVYAQIYRGERWYVLHDQSSEQYMRFNERAYSILGRFDGILTLEEILDHANETQSEYPLTQDDVIGLLGQLDAAEVLRGGLPLNAQDLFLQYQAQKRKKRQRKFLNPLSIKVPIFDPDKLLTSMAPFGRILFSKIGLWVWLVTVFTALVLGLTHTAELGNEISSIEFSPEQLIAVWFIYPLIKAMHELGHGLALKTWGGEVHETGINVLVFMPVPYVDATASWGFGNKWRRMVVGAAGILVELFLASLALFLWLAVEPGLVKMAALNVILIATLSTVLFNGNPLLRYDGYFVLEDWLEIPNLATRSKRYYYYLIQKYILKMPTALNPVTAKGEEKWFLFYGFAAPVYRLVILLSIAIYLVDSFLMIGIALAVWAIMMQVIVPIVKGIYFLVFSEQVAPHRLRGMGLMALFIFGFIFIMSIPVSVITYTEGVVWTTGKSQVSAGTSGFVKNVFHPSNTDVKENQPLLQLEDDGLKAEYEVLKYRLKELRAEGMAQERNSRVKAAMIKDDVDAVKAEYSELSSKVKKLTILSETNGTFISSSFQGLSGQYVHQGDVLGHIITPENMIIKAVIPQSRIGLLETYETSVEFVLVNMPNDVYKSQIIRKIPQASTILVSPVLGSLGGGKFAVDRSDKSGTKLLTPVFHLDLSLPKDLNISYVGSRVYVRFNHGNLPIGEQIGLSFQQLFLRHFYTQ